MAVFTFELTHSPGTVVVVCPVTGSQIRIGDNRPGVGSMDELAVAGINAHMGNTAGICTVEEHDIARFQIGLGNISALLVLVIGGAVGGVAQALQNIIYQA